MCTHKLLNPSSHCCHTHTHTHYTNSVVTVTDETRAPVLDAVLGLSACDPSLGTLATGTTLLDVVDYYVVIPHIANKI